MRYTQRQKTQKTKSQNKTKTLPKDNLIDIIILTYNTDFRAI